jgi:hypothetical protein
LVQVELQLLRVQELMAVIQRLDLSLPRVVEQEQEVQPCFQVLPEVLAVAPTHLIHLARCAVVGHLRKVVIPIGLLSEMLAVSAVLRLSQPHKLAVVVAVQAVQVSQQQSGASPTLVELVSHFRFQALQLHMPQVEMAILMQRQRCNQLEQMGPEMVAVQDLQVDQA